MCPANERQCYNVTSSLIGWAHTQNDACDSLKLSHEPMLIYYQKNPKDLISINVFVEKNLILTMKMYLQFFSDENNFCIRTSEKKKKITVL